MMHQARKELKQGQASLPARGNLEAFDILNNSLAGALHDGTAVQQEMLEKSSQLRKARSDAATPPKKNRKRLENSK